VFGLAGIDVRYPDGSVHESTLTSLYSLYAGATLVPFCGDMGCFQVSLGPQLFAGRSPVTDNVLVIGPQLRVTIPLTAKDMNDLIHRKSGLNLSGD